MIYLIIQRPGWSYFWLYVLSLGISSSITILIQYIYPTAPPWLFSDLPPEAKFYKVDEILSTKLFHGIYGLNKIICGAFPSMHVEWPSIIALNGVVSPYFGITYVLWIMTAAIYSDHHWISDVLIGLCIAVLSVWLSKLYVKDIIFEVKIIDTSSETNP
jgi:membrane-associated phospholipid phosphatase